MIRFEAGVLAYLLNSAWLVPMLFAAGLPATRALRSIGVAAEHRAWVLVLTAQSVLPACSTGQQASSPFAKFHLFSAWVRQNGGTRSHVSALLVPGTAYGTLHLHAAWLGAIALA